MLSCSIYTIYNNKMQCYLCNTLEMIKTMKMENRLVVAQGQEWGGGLGAVLYLDSGSCIDLYMR